MRISTSILSTFLVACGNAACGTAAFAADNLSDPFVRVSAAAWYQQPTVTIKPQGGGSTSGSSVGLDDDHTNVMVDAYVDLPVPLIPGIHAGAWQWKDDADNGADAKVTGGYAVAMWELELIDRVGVALGAGVLAQDLDPATGNREDFLVPAAAARGWVRLTDGLSLEARLMGGALDRDDVIDGVAELNWRLIGPLALIGGWRQVTSTQKLDNGDTWDLTIGGPFLGASAAF
jgi:hypothetical protein